MGKIQKHRAQVHTFLSRHTCPISQHSLRGPGLCPFCPCPGCQARPQAYVPGAQCPAALAPAAPSWYRTFQLQSVRRQRCTRCSLQRRAAAFLLRCRDTPAAGMHTGGPRTKSRWNGAETASVLDDTLLSGHIPRILTLPLMIVPQSPVCLPPHPHHTEILPP